jgi:hypothetical protein
MLLPQRPEAHARARAALMHVRVHPLLGWVQVDINEQEPLFLKGQTARSGQEMSPVRVVKNPDGSMQRAALTQTALAKERREIRRQNERRELEAVPVEMSQPWEDPMAQGDRCVVAGCLETASAWGPLPACSCTLNPVLAGPSRSCSCCLQGAKWPALK